MPFISVKLEGLRDVQLALAALSPDAMKAAEAALIESADDLVADAQALAPKDEGDMADSIHRKNPVVTEHAASIVVQTGTRDMLGIDPDDEYYYPAGVEFGTSEMEPQPFMRPAFERGQAAAQAKIARAIAAAVSK